MQTPLINRFKSVLICGKGPERTLIFARKVIISACSGTSGTPLALLTLCFCGIKLLFQGVSKEGVCSKLLVSLIKNLNPRFTFLNAIYSHLIMTPVYSRKR